MTCQPGAEYASCGRTHRGGHYVWLWITAKTPNGSDGFAGSSGAIRKYNEERNAYLQQRDIAIGERNLALAEIERLKRQAQNPE